VAEKIIAQLGEQSGAFTVDYARATPPSVPRKPNAPKPTGDEKKDAAAKKRYDDDLAKYRSGNRNAPNEQPCQDALDPELVCCAFI